MRKADPELHIRRRVEIVAAAEGCFLKRGFHQTSMQNIAAASGLSMGLLYRYFANKEAIIEAAAQQDQEATLAAISDLSDEGDVIEAWAILITNMAHDASAAEYAGLANEIIAEASRSPKLLAMLRVNDAALALAIGNKLHAQRRAGSVLGLEDIAGVVQTLMMLFDGLTMRHFMTPKTSKKLALLVVKHLLSTLLAPPSP